MSPRRAVGVRQVDMGRNEDTQCFCYAQKAAGQAAHEIKARKDEVSMGGFNETLETGGDLPTAELERSALGAG